MDDKEVTVFATSSRKQKNRSDPTKQPLPETPATEIKGVLHGFEALGLDSWLIQLLRGLAIDRPTDVQKACIPSLLSRKDMIASAKTGSGKTLAFAAPIIQGLSRESHSYFAVILTPTRELAMQISEQFQALCKDFVSKTCLVIGGIDMLKQTLEVAQGPHIIIATPGRLADILDATKLKTPFLKHLVFDEADRLLDPNSTFMVREIPYIMEKLCQADTTLSFFSATVNASISTFYQTHRQSGRLVPFDGNPRYEIPDTLTQTFLLIPSQVKDAYLVKLLNEHLKDQNVIVFVGKCKACELTRSILAAFGHNAVALHGKMSQFHRTLALQKFRRGSASILVTTDVSSRGLDIPSVGAVINFSLPAFTEDYIHRVGRAARIGRRGMAISFVHELDIGILDTLKSTVAPSLKPYDMPIAEADVLETLNDVAKVKRVALMRVHEKQQFDKQKKTMQPA